MTIVLELWTGSDGDWCGRLLDDGEETGRVEGLASRDDVIYNAAEIGVFPSEVRMLDREPPAPD